jgi:hypothetical protein
VVESYLHVLLLVRRGGTIDHCSRGARTKKAHPSYMHSFILLVLRWLMFQGGNFEHRGIRQCLRLLTLSTSGDELSYTVPHLCSQRSAAMSNSLSQQCCAGPLTLAAEKCDNEEAVQAVFRRSPGVVSRLWRVVPQAALHSSLATGIVYWY